MTATRAAASAIAERARLFHALSDGTRLAILDMLRGGERCVCDLQDALDAAQSRLSFHLKVLREAGLVTDRKAGRWSYYSLNPARASDIESFAHELATPRRGAAGAILHQLGKKAAPPRGGSDCCA